MSKMTKKEIYNQVIKADDSEIYEAVREHRRRMDEMVENLIKNGKKNIILKFQGI